ncbi:c-type cytochrome [Acidisoma sp.]|uniref:c-type cytochrome n=1 Tax=Acidisoma sp. TaxID=1872115 RepID=UPI003B00430D
MASIAGNKAFVATLAAGVVVMIAGFAVDVLIHPIEVKRNAAADQDATNGAPAPATGVPSILPLLAGANVALGQSTVAQECGACHAFEAGAPAMVGPSLYGVVGARVAESPGYDYSAALRKAGGIWTYERLNHWLFDPAAFAPGTLMSYAGIQDTPTRADVIAYLRTLSDKPVPLPAAANP